MPPLRVFIGSSREVDKAGWLAKVAVAVEKAGHVPLPWTRQDLFPPGKYIYEAILNIARNVDAAILIFSEDDKVWYREDPSVPQARDNVLIEYGTFSGILGYDRAIMVRVGAPKIPADLQGLIYASLSNSTEYTALESIRIWLEQISAQVEADALDAGGPAGAASPADAFFASESSDKALLSHAQHEAWLLQETVSLLLETGKADLIRVLESGGVVKLVVSTPDFRTSSLLALRNDNLHRIEDFYSRNANLRSQIADLCTRVGQKAERLVVRYLPYPVSSTLTLIDPESDDSSVRQGLVRYAGFQISYYKKPDFLVDEGHSPKIFRTFYDEFVQAYRHASKIILVTASPRAGKTTLFSQLVSQIHPGSEVFYALTHAIWNGSTRRGFELEVSGHSERHLVAERKQASSQLGPEAGPLDDALDRYEVVQAVMDQLISELEVAARQRKIIILDEIGLLQLSNPRFVELIRQILRDESATMIATMGIQETPILREFATHPRALVMRADDGASLQSMAPDLESEIAGSRKLVRLLGVGEQLA